MTKPLSPYRKLAGAVGSVFLLIGLLMPPSALAQFSQSYNFLKAVRDRDGDTITQLLSQPGSVLINTRDVSTGETALHIVIKRRDTTWLGFLLQRGANPNLEDKEGVTPLMLATTLGFIDGAEALLKRGATVDKPNKSGETPLIRAVQLRDLETIRLLLKNGADPDKSDTIAGRSARDYAAADRRNSTVLQVLESVDEEGSEKIVGPVFGPKL